MQVSSPDPIAPNVGGVPQSHNFFHPHFSNHATALAMSDTFNIGVKPLASITGAGYHRWTAQDLEFYCKVAISSGLEGNQYLRLRHV
jgi:hypothetical protein